MLHVVHGQCFFAVFRMVFSDFFVFINFHLHVNPFGYKLTKETLNNDILQNNVLSW